MRGGIANPPVSVPSPDLAEAAAVFENPLRIQFDVYDRRGSLRPKSGRCFGKPDLICSKLVWRGSGRPRTASQMPDSDAVLRPYLECPDEQLADDLLAGLLFEDAEPVVRGVLRRRLRSAACPQDHEDLAGEVILELLARLRRNRETAGACPIECFRAYATTAAHHACDGFFRRRFPRRHCLKNRLRYVLREDRRFAVWPDTNGTTACGRFGWAGRTAGEFPALRVAVLPSAPLETALETVFEAVGGPVELDDVTGFLAAAWGLHDAEVPIESLDRLGAPVADPALLLDMRRRLEHLWAGILLLPVAQRAALLLHLRDDRGGPALALLPASGLASIARIAEVLEISVEELVGLWNRLPLRDTEIGTRLRVKRQQVINLRSAARQRLTRRDACYGAGA